MLHGSISVRNGKAYVCTVALTGAGVGVFVEPILVTAIEPKELSAAIQKTLDFGHPRVPELQTLYPRNHPLLTAAGVKSWREFERGLISFSLFWGNEWSSLGVADESTHFVGYNFAHQYFPPNTSPSVICDEIVRYWETHADPALQRRSVIWVHDQRAYLPMPGKTEAGFFIDAQPVQRIELIAEQLNKGVSEVLAAPPTTVTKGRVERWMGHPEEKHPLLREAGVRTYQQLRRESVLFTLAWRIDSTRLYVTKPSHEASAGWRDLHEFPQDAPAGLLVDLMLRCLASEPWTK